MLEISSFIWGSKFWYILHYIVNKYNSKYQKDFKNFFISLKYILPCPVCREHFSKMIYSNSENSIYIFNNKNLDKKMVINWLFRVHNSINLRIDNLVYNKKVLDIYNSKKIYKHNLFYIIDILLHHDEKNFKKLKYFFILVSLLDTNLTHMLDTIPNNFNKDNKTFEWIIEFKKNIA